MKCPNCNGTGQEYSFYDGAESVWKDAICPTCNGTGEVEQTNEEWAKSLDTEHFAKLLSDAMLYGQQCEKDDVTCEECGCPWCKTDSISEWLKKPHKI